MSPRRTVRDGYDALAPRFAAWMEAVEGDPGSASSRRLQRGLPGGRLLRQSGFRLVLDEVVKMSEPEGKATFLWVLAEKPS